MGHLRGRPRKIPFFDVLIDMGRIPIPTEILDTRGSFLKHPERRRPNEPYETRPLGSPPKYLSDEAKKLWKEIAHNLPPGVGSAGVGTLVSLSLGRRKKVRRIEGSS